MSDSLVGKRVRFRRNPRTMRGWSTGLVIGFNKDESVAIIDDRKGHVVNRFPDALQEQATGPRGGKVWVDV